MQHLWVALVGQQVCHKSCNQNNSIIMGWIQRFFIFLYSSGISVSSQLWSVPCEIFGCRRYRDCFWRVSLSIHGLCTRFSSDQPIVIATYIIWESDSSSSPETLSIDLKKWQICSSVFPVLYVGIINIIGIIKDNLLPSVTWNKSWSMTGMQDSFRSNVET